MECVWMSDGTLLHPDDVEAYVAENPDVFVAFHFKDYIGVAKFNPDSHELDWMLYRQYSYLIQTEFTRDVYGFTEDIGERIHAKWDPDIGTYVPSDEAWLMLQTYFVLPEGDVPSMIDHDKGPYRWLATIYDAFPDEFNGFRYDWLPESP